MDYCVPKMQSQDVQPSNAEQQLENLAQANDSESEDDSWLQELVHFRKNPINLNRAGEEDLIKLKILTDLQIANFIAYRRLLGRLLSIYELQAIPSWDVYTIKKILPFVVVANDSNAGEEMTRRLSGGEHSLLLRCSQVLNKSVGYTKKSSGTYYLGSPQKIFFRYRYQYKNLLQYGLTGDKDAGEQFFKGGQKYGFDFYSFHVFVKRLGIVQAMALGDFTVNLGQGLIQWQNIAFRKGVDISLVKRQSPVLRPYNSAGEYNFHRGAGLTVKKGNLEATAFLSFRKINANIATDTLNATEYFTSFLTSGYNRTQSEIDDKNKLKQISFGGNISFSSNNFHAGINGIAYRFSAVLQKREEPYNLYSIAGKRWSNVSADYSYTWRNVHFFGEAALDENRYSGFVNGLIVSADPKIDLSLVHRFIDAKFQSINGNAFTENTFPSNENGLYAGITFRPGSSFRVDAYADFYKFPWLKYGVDAPSYGKDFFIQCTYTPNKQTEIYMRYRDEEKQANWPNNSTATNQLLLIPKKNWRTQVSFQASRSTTLRSRIELNSYAAGTNIKESGFLSFFDCLFNPPMKRLSASARLQYFETGGYNTRLYAYENDLIYNYSIPVFFDKGYRYYINLGYDPAKKVSVWFKWSGSVYPGKTSIGTGLDEIKGNTKNEAKIQIMVYL
jgi:hypothetical protein